MGRRSSMVVKHTGVTDFSAWMEKFNNKDRMEGKKNTKAWDRTEVHYDPDTSTVYVKHWHKKDDAAAMKHIADFATAGKKKDMKFEGEVTKKDVPAELLVESVDLS